MEEFTEHEGAGRPCHMTPELRAALVEGYKLHGSHTAAAGYAHVARQTAKGWIEKYSSLAVDIQAARAEWTRAEWEKLDADTAWQARRYRLSVVNRAEFTEVQQVETTQRIENVHRLDDRTEKLLREHLAGRIEEVPGKCLPAPEGVESAEE